MVVLAPGQGSVVMCGPWLSLGSALVPDPGLTCLQPCSSLLALLGNRLVTSQLTVEWCLVNAGCDPEPWVGSSDR